MESLNELRAFLETFPSNRLLVLGDVILDRYWWGECDRLSPEAPVPIVRKQRSTVRPGGAANTAANLVALGAAAAIAGVVGADGPAAELRNELKASGITAFLVEDPARPTTSKTRIMAVHQQVARVDEEETTALPDDLAAAVAQWVAGELASCQGVVISDYGKGFLTPGLLARVIALANEKGCRTFVDPKGAGFKRYSGCFLLKPNRLELGHLTGMPVRNREETLKAGRALASWMPGTTILVTEGAEGMTAFSPDGREEHVSSIRRQVFDVTGAGDTVLATVSLAICAGATLRQAVELASRAAAIAVSGMGTVAVTREQLAGALEAARSEPG
jgi:D-beta-D-heptose 7-phosphate kinase/D-beta-D-heptose 1-phosphate adenosyltransferase